MKKIVVIVLALVLSACGGTAAPDEQPARADAVFLSVVHDTIPETIAVPDETVIGAAKQVCENFEQIPITSETVMSAAEGFVEGSHGQFDYKDAGSFFGAATAAYCPDINDQLIDLIERNT